MLVVNTVDLIAGAIYSLNSMKEVDMRSSWLYRYHKIAMEQLIKT